MKNGLRAAGRASLAVILSAAMIVAGCSTSWIKTALADLPVIVQVAESIAQIVAVAQSKGQVPPQVSNEIQSISAQVKNDLTLVESLVADYQSSTAATKPSIAQKLNAALGDLQTNLAAILTAVHVNDAALQATITGAVGIAISTVTAIESLVPAPAGTIRASKPVSLPSAKQLKGEFNAVFAAHGFGAYAVR